MKKYELSARVRSAASIEIAFTCRGTGKIDIRLQGEWVVGAICSSTSGRVIHRAAYSDPSVRDFATIEVVAQPSSEWRMAYSTGRTVS